MANYKVKRYLSATDIVEVDADSEENAEFEARMAPADTFELQDIEVNEVEITKSPTPEETEKELYLQRETEGQTRIFA